MKINEQCMVTFEGEKCEGVVHSIYNNGETANVRTKYGMTTFPIFMVSPISEKELKVKSKIDEAKNSNVFQSISDIEFFQIKALSENQQKRLVILKKDYSDLKMGAIAIDICDVFGNKTIQTLLGKYYSIPKQLFNSISIDDWNMCNHANSIDNANDNSSNESVYQSHNEVKDDDGRNNNDYMITADIEEYTSCDFGQMCFF